MIETFAKIVKGVEMNKKVIYLAGGCFWGVERYFQILGKGILETETGYANGTSVAPTYAEVCSGETGFAETVKLTYDADILTLNEIMAHYFRIVDPTTRDRQGNDIGTQYRSGVYYENKEDFEIVCDYIDFCRKDYERPIVIEVLELKNYYTAEDYHQDYLKNRPSGYCHVNLSLADEPLKAEELPREFEERVHSGRGCRRFYLRKRPMAGKVGKAAISAGTVRLSRDRMIQRSETGSPNFSIASHRKTRRNARLIMNLTHTLNPESM